MPETQRKPDGSPELYPLLLRGLQALARRIIETETAMAALAKTYAIQIPRCQLALYPKVEPQRCGKGGDAGPNPRFTGRPRALYWGRVVNHIVIHLSGFMNGGRIVKIALRAKDKPLFWAFERKRLYLNRSRSRLVTLRETLRKILTPHAREPLALPPGPEAGDLYRSGARDLRIIQGLFALAREAEDLPRRRAAFLERFRRAAAAVPPPRVGLTLRQLHDARAGNARIYAAVGRARYPVERLSHRFLRPLGLGRELEDFYLRFRREAATLNREASLLRARLARVRQLLVEAAKELRVRNRPPWRNQAVG